MLNIKISNCTTVGGGGGGAAKYIVPGNSFDTVFEILSQIIPMQSSIFHVGLLPVENPLTRNNTLLRLRYACRNKLIRKTNETVCLYSMIFHWEFQLDKIQQAINFTIMMIHSWNGSHSPYVLYMHIANNQSVCHKSPHTISNKKQLNHTIILYIKR